jgi:hypothetical protein
VCVLARPAQKAHIVALVATNNERKEQIIIRTWAFCLSVCLLHKEDHEQEKDRVLAGRVSLGHSFKAPPVVGIRSHFARPRSPATVVQDGDSAHGGPGSDLCIHVCLDRSQPTYLPTYLRPTYLPRYLLRR